MGTKKQYDERRARILDIMRRSAKAPVGGGSAADLPDSEAQARRSQEEFQLWNDEQY